MANTCAGQQNALSQHNAASLQGSGRTEAGGPGLQPKCCDPEQQHSGSRSLSRPQEGESLRHELLLFPPHSTTRSHQATTACLSRYSTKTAAWVLGEMEGTSALGEDKVFEQGEKTIKKLLPP